MFNKKSGSKLISDAMGIFQNAVDKLEEGCELISKEIDTHQTNLKEEEKKFVEFKKETSEKIDSLEQEHSKATQSITNIRNLIG